MAITFVNNGGKVVADAAREITLVAPASPQTDDVWIAAIFDRAGDADVHSFTDWTELAQGNGGSTVCRLGVWYFRYAGSSPNLTATGLSDGTLIGSIAAFRGVKTSGSPANTVGSISTGTDGSIEHSAISPSVECALLVINGSIDDNNRTALGGDYSLAFDDGGGVNCFKNATADDESLAMSYDLSVPASSTGTVTQTQAAADEWNSVLIALEPAGAAPAGWPSYYNDGGVRFSENNAHHSQGNNLWRRALNGLYLPKPRFA